MRKVHICLGFNSFIKAHRDYSDFDKALKGLTAVYLSTVGMKQALFHISHRILTDYQCNWKSQHGHSYNDDNQGELI